MQQTQRKNDKPIAEPIALNRITFSPALLFDVGRIGDTSFNRKETDVTVNICPSTIISEVCAVQFCNIVIS